VKARKPAKKTVAAKKPVKKILRKEVPIIRTTGKPNLSAVYRKPETSQIWQKLGSIKISGKDECIDAFLRIMREVENRSYALQLGERDMGKYVLVHEQERQGSMFIHVVPKEAYKMFQEMRRQMPDSFLGFSVLCGKIAGRPVRVSCFAVPTSEITRAIIGKK
jgi:hypothetical protein